MNTNTFLISGVLLETDIPAVDMEEIVNDQLQEITSGLVKFEVKEQSLTHIEFVLIRDFNIETDKPIIFDTDMALITGFNIKCFQSSEVGGYPCLFPLRFADRKFFTDMTSFIRLYKFYLTAIEKQEVRDIGIRCLSDQIIMRIEF